MKRNLSRRVELLFPVIDPQIKAQVQHIYDVLWADNVKTRVLAPDNSWQRIDLRGVTKEEAQATFMAEATAAQHRQEQAAESAADENPRRFTPMKAPEE